MFTRNQKINIDRCMSRLVKDGAYYCYCAYVLCIARYSGFLWVVPTNTRIFLRGLKLYGKKQNLPNVFGISKENWG